MTRLIDVCSICSAEVEHDAAGPCCAGADVVQVSLLSALESTGRDLAAETLRIQAEQLDRCATAPIEDRAAAHRLLVDGAGLDPVTDARCSARVAWAWQRMRDCGAL